MEFSKQKQFQNKNSEIFNNTAEIGELKVNHELYFKIEE